MRNAVDPTLPSPGPCYGPLTLVENAAAKAALGSRGEWAAPQARPADWAAYCAASRSCVGGAAGWAAIVEQVRERASAVGRCGPHVAISPAMLRSSNGVGWAAIVEQLCGEEGAAAVLAAATTTTAAAAAAPAAGGAAAGSSVFSYEAKKTEKGILIL